MSENLEGNIFKASQEDQYELSNRNFLQKFEFFIISLTFTVLGLSIQTAIFKNYTFANTLELCAWLFFLVSGIFGLFKLKILIHRFRREDDYYIFRNWEPPDKESAKKFFLKEPKNINNRTRFQWIFLILGFLALMISRGFEPFMKIIKP